MAICKNKRIAQLGMYAACLLGAGEMQAQSVHQYKDSVVVAAPQATVVLHKNTGKVDYRFANGIVLNNTIAYVQTLPSGNFSSDAYTGHSYTINEIKDSVGAGFRINIKHEESGRPVSLVQHITLYRGRRYMLLSVDAVAAAGATVETRNISPLTVSPAKGGSFSMPGAQARLLDVPFDNDNWVGAVARSWPAAGSTPPVAGTSYELAGIYDNASLSGVVVGSVVHNFWKTGIVYRTGDAMGRLDSLCIYGGAATADNKAAPQLYGLDGTHDHAPHGTAIGQTVHSPLIYLSSQADVRTAFVDYGKVNAQINGSLTWKGEAPMYWNSFGVEDVLGARGIMQPPGVLQTSDFLHSLHNLSSHRLVLSIDSYDRGIYNVNQLKAIGEYGAQRGQEMGFYFIPFSVWTFRDAFDKPLEGTDTPLRDVLLLDTAGKGIFYKEGNFGAYAIDPTHPAVRKSIISQIMKAKAINAKFIKIDFLTAGSLETTRRYDPNVRTGAQAYDQGMKMVKHLIDSIMGPDIFITEAISPMFPSQYAHTRFISTDVYSHLRDDEPGFPHYGSTGSSLTVGSHMWWMKGTLWPYTNLDVVIMKAFQHNPDLSETEIKVRLYAMMVMGSILGDGSDLRQPLAAERAKKFLDNKALCDYFAHPQVFTPLQFSDGETLDQQMSFYLKGTTTMIGLFNFSNKQDYAATVPLKAVGLQPGKYNLVDFLTGQTLGTVDKGATAISLTVPQKDAYLVKVVRVKE